MKCEDCGIKIPNLPEDTTPDERLCDRCYAKWEAHLEAEYQALAHLPLS